MDSALLRNLPSIGAAFDTETALITSTCAAPPLVCAAIATKDGASLLDKNAARKAFRELLKPGVVVIGANLPFDMLVMAQDARNGSELFPPEDLIPAIFEKYNRGEIFDVLICQMLDAIGGGHLNADPRDFGPLRDPITKKQVSRYSLAVVSDQVLGRYAKQHDYWRLRYAILDRVPISEWPEEARIYPVDDVVNPRDVALAQAGHIPRGDGRIEVAHNLHALAEICRAAFALHLGAAWGFVVDQDRITALEEETRKNVESGADRFRALGLIRPDGTQDKSALKKLVAAAYSGGFATDCEHCDQGKAVSSVSGKPSNCKVCAGTGTNLDDCDAIPRTPKGGVMTSRDILVDSDDPNLVAFGDWGEDLKTLSTYIPGLRSGVPLRPNVPLANERVSYSGIVQTMPRKNSAHGDVTVRECVISRPGTVLCSIDFAGVELATWAQVCLWLVKKSNLADAINSGKDPHSILGADLCGITYDEFLPRKKGDLADYRQAGKWGNFGLPGGMGVPKFIVTLRKAPGMTTIAPDGRVYKGVRLCVLIGGKTRCGDNRIQEYRKRAIGSPVCADCIRQGEIVRAAWFKRWTEAQDYFAYVNQQVETLGYITHFGSQTRRGGIEFTQAANSYFSQLAAFGAKRALWAVSQEAYTDRTSALWGTRPIGFIHDEIVAEMPEDRANDAAHRMADIMVGVMQRAVPDVKISAEPALMRRLYKGAEPVYENGQLIPWEPA